MNYSEILEYCVLNGIKVEQEVLNELKLELVQETAGTGGKSFLENFYDHLIKFCYSSKFDQERDAAGWITTIFTQKNLLNKNYPTKSLQKDLIESLNCFNIYKATAIKVSKKYKLDLKAILNDNSIPTIFSVENLLSPNIDEILIKFLIVNSKSKEERNKVEYRLK